MVAMLDVDHSGKLGIEEFKKLMIDIGKWRTVFKSFDHDQSGKFNTFELRAALEASGYKLSNHVLNALVHRYGSRDGLIGFDDFIMCAIKIKTMIGKYFKCLDTEHPGQCGLRLLFKKKKKKNHIRFHIITDNFILSIWLLAKSI